MKLRSSPLTPALNILELKHAGLRHLYISAWYCTDCFSACNLKTAWIPQICETKGLQLMLHLTLSMHLNRRSLIFLRIAEGMFGSWSWITMNCLGGESRTWDSCKTSKVAFCGKKLFTLLHMCSHLMGYFRDLLGHCWTLVLH